MSVSWQHGKNPSRKSMPPPMNLSHLLLIFIKSPATTEIRTFRKDQRGHSDLTPFGAGTLSAIMARLLWGFLDSKSSKPCTAFPQHLRQAITLYHSAQNQLVLRPTHQKSPACSLCVTGLSSFATTHRLLHMLYTHRNGAKSQAVPTNKHSNKQLCPAAIMKSLPTARDNPSIPACTTPQTMYPLSWAQRLGRHSTMNSKSPANMEFKTGQTWELLQKRLQEEVPKLAHAAEWWWGLLPSY